MRLEFIKCHGSGNDFPMIDARRDAADPAPARFGDDDWRRIAVLLADRRGPVGGDGLLLLVDGRGDAAFGMRMFNSDGSEAETCLNGLRCVARLGFETLGIDAATVSLRTSTAHVARAPELAPGVVSIRETAGPADLDLSRWPMGIGVAENVAAPIAPLPSDRAFTAVAMPNPHLVAFVDTVDEAELVAVGEACEAAPAWLPNRANVSFVEQRGGDLFVRTFERGVGLTDSCGSAMAASTYAAGLTGRIGWDREITVFNRGGLVRASADAGGTVTLVGNATFEWNGAIDVTGAVAGDLTVRRHRNDEIDAWAALVEAAG